MQKQTSRRKVLKLVSAIGSGAVAKLSLMVPEIAAARQLPPGNRSPQPVPEGTTTGLPIERSEISGDLRHSLVAKSESESSVKSMIKHLQGLGLHVKFPEAKVIRVALLPDYVPDTDVNADEGLKNFFARTIRDNNRVVAQIVKAPITSGDGIERGTLEVAHGLDKLGCSAIVWDDIARTAAKIYRPSEQVDASIRTTGSDIINVATLSLTSQNIQVGFSNGRSVSLQRSPDQLGIATNACPAGCPRPPTCKELCEYVCNHVCVWSAILFDTACSFTVGNVLVCTLIAIGWGYVCTPVCNWACRRVCN
jgi:hypothetical protein